eukprot:Trichotokara_eunicae@DN5511_c0_g1_i2.p1
MMGLLTVQHRKGDKLSGGTPFVPIPLPPPNCTAEAIKNQNRYLLIQQKNMPHLSPQAFSYLGSLEASNLESSPSNAAKGVGRHSSDGSYSPPYYAARLRKTESSSRINEVQSDGIDETKYEGAMTKSKENSNDDMEAVHLDFPRPTMRKRNRSPTVK